MYTCCPRQNHKIFSDFANLATFLIPRCGAPWCPLPCSCSALPCCGVPCPALLCRSHAWPARVPSRHNRHALPRLPANVASLLGFAAAGADGAADATVVSPPPRTTAAPQAKREADGAPEAVERRPAKRGRIGNSSGNGTGAAADESSTGAADAPSGSGDGAAAGPPAVCPYTGAVAE